METMSERIESTADLRDSIDVKLVFADVQNKEVTFEEAIRVQMEFNGVDASDEIVTALAEELEAEMTQRETTKMAA